MAGELNISLRTLYRDIAALQAQGAHIEGEPGVGYVLRPGLYAAAADAVAGGTGGAGAGHALGGRSRRHPAGRGGAERPDQDRRRPAQGYGG
ncbi:MAG: HTH domain-containing protein [Asticcacaulis sp.]